MGFMYKDNKGNRCIKFKRLSELAYYFLNSSLIFSYVHV